MRSLLLFLGLLIGQFNLAQAQTERLIEGEKAPKTTFEAIDGESYKLKELLKENDRVLITFLRPTWCPVCNFRTHELKDNYESLKAQGYAVIVVYPSPKDRLKALAEDAELPFIVVADPDEELFEAYKIEKSAGKVRNSIFSKKVRKAAKKGKKAYDGEKYPKKGNRPGPIIPADFVIQDNQELEQVHYGKNIADHITIKSLLK